MKPALMGCSLAARQPPAWAVPSPSRGDTRGQDGRVIARSLRPGKGFLEHRLPKGKCVPCAGLRRALGWGAETSAVHGPERQRGERRGKSKTIMSN